MPAATSRSAASWAAAAGVATTPIETCCGRTICGQIVERRDRTPPMTDADLGSVDIDDAGDGEASIAEPAVAREGLTEVAGADDHDGPVVGEAELAADLVDQVLDLVADATGAVRAEIAEILADLGRVDTREVGELVRRDVRLPDSDCSGRIRRYTGKRATVASGMRRPRLVVAIAVHPRRSCIDSQSRPRPSRVPGPEGRARSAGRRPQIGANTPSGRVGLRRVARRSSLPVAVRGSSVDEEDLRRALVAGQMVRANARSARPRRRRARRRTTNALTASPVCGCGTPMTPPRRRRDAPSAPPRPRRGRR